MAILATASVLAGCGAEAVDPSAEAEVLVETCRSWIERGTSGEQVTIDADELEDYLRSEPGGDERAPAGITRQLCTDALKQERNEGRRPDPGPGGAPGS